MDGFLALILTAHVPYVRNAGRHPHGEELLHETIATALIPALNTLFDLRESVGDAPIGLAVSPILLEQLSDSVVQKHFLSWMEGWLEDRASALSRWERQQATHASYIGRFSLDWGRGVLRSFTERYGRNLADALRTLCSGLAEPLNVPATHAYLPLLATAGSVSAQLQAGARTIEQRLGQRPEGLWLPECGYHPALLPAITGSDAHYLVADPTSSPSDEPYTYLQPAWAIPGRLQVLTREPSSAALVWSTALGYPGDPVYRSLRRDPRTGMELWRNGAPGGPEVLYDPYDAFRRAEEHAAHFLDSVGAELAGFSRRHDRPGVVVVPIDLELLGRRWFEGPIWLRAVLERALRGDGPALTAPSAYLRAFQPQQNTTLRAGSWGPGGGHSAWESPEARPIWRAIGEAEERMADMLRSFPAATGDRARALDQALRELLLAQSSDWPLLAGRGAAQEAFGRVARHLERFERLCRIAEEAAPAAHSDAIAEVEDLDSVFAQLSYQAFAGHA